VQAADGSLAPAKKLEQGPAYGGPVVADLDGDGDNDAAIGTPTGIAFYEQAGGTLSDPVALPGAPVLVAVIEADDVNGDGADDLVAGTATGIQALIQQATGVFESKAVSTLPAESFATGDVNGDRRSDVVAVSTYDQPVAFRIYRQLAGGGYAERPIPLTYDDDPNRIALADVTGDGRDDLVATRGGNSPYAKLVVYPQTGGSIDPPAQVYRSYDIPEAVQTGDMDGDGREDVVVVHVGWGRVGIYRQAPDGKLYDEELIPSPAEFGGHRLALGDISSDGLMDFAIAGYNGLSVRRQRPPFSLSAAAQPDGRITASWKLPAGMRTEFIEVANSPGVHGGGRLAHLFSEENVVLYDDNLFRSQETWSAADVLPAGTYYVHLRAWDDQSCAVPDQADCLEEVSATSVVSIAAPAGSSQAAIGADNVVSLTRLGAAAQQSVRKLRVTVTMGEPGTVTVGGSITVPGTARTYRLRPASATTAAGGTVTLRPRLTKHARRAVLRALRRHRRIVAALTITARDRVGNTRRDKRAIRLAR
jgi:hypothetical protein